ncbi:dienelactone hydrolase family protein [Bacteroides faecalis]|uniref:Phospholipase n=1 Tax=Bacteroides faecalis TaxID=2447885 RepID=A0A401LNW4_9BACE|nr:dienelactone hydrolase family protein [Bacteroides faecalis]GCB33226.1 phospholipase [Bacteroides faecalis]GCB37545.1 phospholipase [Bacteroides faecalis]
MKQWTAFIAFFFLSISLSAQQRYGKELYEKEVFVSTQGDSLLYRLLRPEAVKPGKKFPLVLFLHGAGERGNDNERQLTHGGQMFLNPVNREKHPAFVLIPQCPQGKYWGYVERPKSFTPSNMPVGQEMNPIFRAVKELLDSYLNMPEIDKKRIYIVGLSMGAMGTFDMISRYPEIFTAAIPICGTVNPDRLSAAKDIKFRIFHGDADDVVTVEGSRDAYKALKAAGADVEYIEFPGCGHNSWDSAFNYPGFMDWLFKQKK